jgi:hypothetical protein
MPRLPAVVLNTLLPGVGLLLRRPGWLPTLIASIGVAGLTLLAIALLTSGLAFTIAIGWLGLGLYASAILLASMLWYAHERPSSRDLGEIQPLFRAIAKQYLRGDVAQAERDAQRLTRLAGAESGAWRLLAMMQRARGMTKNAARSEKIAQRLDHAS